jgi:hypothetical protein
MSKDVSKIFIVLLSVILIAVIAIAGSLLLVRAMGYKPPAALSMGPAYRMYGFTMIDVKDEPRGGAAPASGSSGEEASRGATPGGEETPAQTAQTPATTTDEGGAADAPSGTAGARTDTSDAPSGTAGAQADTADAPSGTAGARTDTADSQAAGVEAASDEEYVAEAGNTAGNAAGNATGVATGNTANNTPLTGGEPVKELPDADVPASSGAPAPEISYVDLGPGTRALMKLGPPLAVFGGFITLIVCLFIGYIRRHGE